MTGAPIFLVSACASGEEFVAAFRRYADRNGLFVPIATPLPAGRRGRFAVTLEDGGVMIEGEADIVSSATTPSVLHGRVGMTLRFVEPDIRSKTVLIELEQARLAMKPQPPSVPPRPAQVPAEPRPKVPAIAGRIDANNALAECVAIGDVDGLEATAPQVPKAGGPRFVVPTIPPVAGRPKSPSTSPGYTAKPATIPPPVRAQPPSVPAIPPKLPGAPALARPAGTQPPRPQPATLPPLAKPSGAQPPLARSTADVPALPRTSTLQGAPPPAATEPTGQSDPTLVAPPIVTTASGAMAPIVLDGPVTPMNIPAVDAPLDVPAKAQGWDTATLDDTDNHVDFAGEEPPRDTLAMPAVAPAEAVAALVRSRSASDELTIVPYTRAAEIIQVTTPEGNDSDTHTAVAPPVPMIDGVPEAVPEDPPSISRPHANSGRVALPPPRRTTGTTQPPPIPRQPTPSAPLPVVSAKPTLSGIAPVRAPTQLGLPIVERRPAPRTGEVPLPPVVAEARAKPAPEASDEPTDITGVPVVAESEDAAVIASAPAADPAPLPGTVRKTVMGIAVVPAGGTVLPASSSGAIAKVTDKVLVEEPVAQAEVEPYLAAAIHAAKREVSLDDAAADEPTAKPAQRLPVIEEPSGDWTMIPGAEGPTIIAATRGAPILPRVADGGPAGDWTIARTDASPDGWSEPAKVEVVRPNLRSNTGPPVAMVAGEKPLEVTMTAKAFDIEEETKSSLKVEVDASLGVERPTGGLDIAFQSTQFSAVQPVSTPPPGRLAAPVIPAAPLNPSTMPPMVRMPGAGSGSFPDYPARHALVGDSTSMIDTGKKTRVVIIAVSAGLAILAGVVLLIVFGFGDDPPPSAKPSQAIAPVPVDAALVAAADAAAAEAPDAAAAEAPDAAAPATVPAATDTCFVEIASTPSDAEVVRGDLVLGTTPVKLELPCGAEVKLTLRKAKFASSTRTVTPTPEGAKVKVALGKTLFAVKVTSSPPGATITIAGKSAGVTPAMVKLPAGEQAQITIAKPGFNPDTPKITPKQNNQSVHVNLKKKGR